MKRRPEITHTSPRPFGGTIRHERFAMACDLVDADEARSRLGVGADDDVLSALAKRRGQALAPGATTWLVDLAALAEPATIDDLIEGGALEVLESGSSL
jgi:hypothetical protein